MLGPGMFHPYSFAFLQGSLVKPLQFPRVLHNKPFKPRLCSWRLFRITFDSYILPYSSFPTQQSHSPEPMSGPSIVLLWDKEMDVSWQSTQPTRLMTVSSIVQQNPHDLTLCTKPAEGSVSTLDWLAQVRHVQRCKVHTSPSSFEVPLMYNILIFDFILDFPTFEHQSISQLSCSVCYYCF